MPDEFALHLGHIVEPSVHVRVEIIKARVDIIKAFVESIQPASHDGQIALDVDKSAIHTIKSFFDATEAFLYTVQPLLNALYLFVEFLYARLKCVREPAADRFDALANCLHRLIHSAIL